MSMIFEQSGRNVFKLKEEISDNGVTLSGFSGNGTTITFYSGNISGLDDEESNKLKIGHLQTPLNWNNMMTAIEDYRNGNVSISMFRTDVGEQKLATLFSKLSDEDFNTFLNKPDKFAYVTSLSPSEVKIIINS